MKLTNVLRRPLITEKTTVIREDGRTLVFQVARDANKIDIKKAVESLLGSKVESVRTSLAHGKFKRQGKYIGRRSDWKKAYVKLREGEKLIGQGQGLAEVCKQLEISEPTWHRWVAQYGGMKADGAKRLRELESENARLKKLLAEAELDKAMLKELAEGTF